MNQLSAGPLLVNGRLSEAGYARSLLKSYDRKDVAASALRIKEWDYYLVYNDSFAVALTIDDNGYMGLCSASFIDLEQRREVTKSHVNLFPLGRTHLPPSSASGITAWSHGRTQASFTHENGTRQLRMFMDKMSSGQPFVADITLSDEPQDSMVIATPFAEKDTAFYYNQKIVGMRAEGAVTFEGREYSFSPDDSFGLLDWGRGVWTYDNTWYWSAAQGMTQKGLFGFNLGYGFGDTSAASENMVFLNGSAHKLDRISFNIPEDSDGDPLYMERWTFSSSDGRFFAYFVPTIDRSSRTSAGVLLSDQHQVFGRFTGYAVTDDGSIVRFSELTGFAEKVRNKW